MGILKPVPQTVLIIDDHAGFRHAARALLEADGFNVIGESATGTEGLEAVKRLRPDVSLLDGGLPGLDGIAVAAVFMVLAAAGLSSLEANGFCNSNRTTASRLELWPPGRVCTVRHADG